jgi:hypothetical protein
MKWTPAQIVGSAMCSWIGLNLHSSQNRIEILIIGRRIFLLLIFVGSNPQIQLEKYIFWPRNRRPMPNSQKGDKNNLPVDVHSTTQKCRRSLSELSKSVLWFSVRNNISARIRMGSSGNFWSLPVSTRFEMPQRALKRLTPQIWNLAILIFPWISGRSLQLYFWRSDFPSETISVSIYVF